MLVNAPMDLDADCLDRYWDDGRLSAEDCHVPDQEKPERGASQDRKVCLQPDLLLGYASGAPRTPACARNQPSRSDTRRFTGRGTYLEQHLQTESESQGALASPRRARELHDVLMVGRR